MDADVKIVDSESPTTGLSVTNATAVGTADKQSSSESKEKDKVEGIEIVNVVSPTAGPEGISTAAVEASAPMFSGSMPVQMMVVYAGYCATNHSVVRWSKSIRFHGCDFILGYNFVPMFAFPGQWIFSINWTYSYEGCILFVAVWSSDANPTANFQVFNRLSSFCSDVVLGEVSPIDVCSSRDWRGHVNLATVLMDDKDVMGGRLRMMCIRVVCVATVLDPASVRPAAFSPVSLRCHGSEQRRARRARHCTTNKAIKKRLMQQL